MLNADVPGKFKTGCRSLLHDNDRFTKTVSEQTQSVAFKLAPSLSLVLLRLA